MKQPLEKYIVSQIMAALKKQPGVVVRKRHGTAMGMAGDPDLYGTINGQHFEIEVKRPGENLTPLQAQRLNEWQLGGALVAVAHNPEEALLLLGRTRPSRPYWICTNCRCVWPGSAAPDFCPNCGNARFDSKAVA